VVGELLTRAITPVKFKLDGVDVTLIEVIRSELITGDKWYHVRLQLEWKGTRSTLFTLDVKDMDHLKKKLFVEISKFKLSIIMKGLRSS